MIFPISKLAECLSSDAYIMFLSPINLQAAMLALLVSSRHCSISLRNCSVTVASQGSVTL